jgi:hypothetical protein
MTKRYQHKCSGCGKMGYSKNMIYAVVNDKFFCPNQKCLDKYRAKVDGN